jgi:hypothetical protein
MFETGMGTVLVSRAMPNGFLGVSCFLLDVFCLGVKNAYFVVEPRAAYQWRLENIRSHERIEAIAPEYARKLVEDTEAYARDLGFSPHPDYQLAKRLFADIDATACHTRFPFFHYLVLASAPLGLTEDETVIEAEYRRLQ